MTRRSQQGDRRRECAAWAEYLGVPERSQAELFARTDAERLADIRRKLAACGGCSGGSKADTISRTALDRDKRFWVRRCGNVG